LPAMMRPMKSWFHTRQIWLVIGGWKMRPEEIYKLKIRMAQLEAENKILSEKIVRLSGSNKYGRPCGKEAWLIADPILQDACVSREQFLSRSKPMYLTHVRARVYIALYDTGRWSLAAIGKMTGRHHATVHQQIRIHRGKP